MSKAFVFATTAIFAIAILPWTVSAGPQHPDTAVHLAMQRAGSDLKAKVTLENVGGANAHNVRLKVQLPGTGWAFAAPDCSTSGGNIECRIQELAKGKTWTLAASRASAPCESMSATAKAETPADKQPGNDKATASTNAVCGLADLVLQKVGVRRVAEIQFTLFLTNDGPRTSHSIVLVDDLPTHPTFRWRLEGGDSRECTLIKNRVECRWSELSDGSRKMVNVVTPATLCSSAYNEAYVTSADDPEPLNNVSSAMVRSLCPL